MDVAEMNKDTMAGPQELFVQGNDLERVSGDGVKELKFNTIRFELRGLELDIQTRNHRGNEAHVLPVAMIPLAVELTSDLKDFGVNEFHWVPAVWRSQEGRITTQEDVTITLHYIPAN